MGTSSNDLILCYMYEEPLDVLEVSQPVLATLLQRWINRNFEHDVYYQLSFGIYEVGCVSEDELASDEFRNFSHQCELTY